VSVTAASGFRAAGVAAGIKAAPVLWSSQVLADGRLRAVVLNSGGANACTGPEGFADSHRTAEAVADALSIGAGEVAVCSTGLIGERLPLDAVLAGVVEAAKALCADGAPAAEAIRTTDTVSKQAAVTAQAGWTVGGMAKGAGMLAPALATMLCVLTTDAVVDGPQLQAALRSATSRTFDRLDSDGCMSTNDTVLLLASGASGVAPEADEFAAAVETICADLAWQLLADAEGATKDIEITVQQAVDEADAVEVARAVARSNLLKCALFGNDPNWGRVLAAAGTTQARFDSDRVDVAINGVRVCVNGAAGADRSLVDLAPRAVRIVVDLNAGDAAATVWTNDLSIAYVEENSAYSS
jgi:glutamate N-acetyltransferase/amino-acid N-acetyltransferase